MRVRGSWRSGRRAGARGEHRHPARSGRVMPLPGVERLPAHPPDLHGNDHLRIRATTPTPSDEAAACQALPRALAFPGVTNGVVGEEPEGRNGAGFLFCDGFMG